MANRTRVATIEQRGGTTLITQLTSNWWKPVAMGVIAIIFGILLFVYPQAGITAFVSLFGAYMLLDGIAAIAMSVDLPSGRGWMLLGGLAGIAVGILTFVYPGVTATTLVYLVGAWAIITGIFEIGAAIEYRKVISNEWSVALRGVVSVVLGLVLFYAPDAGMTAYVWLVGLCCDAQRRRGDLSGLPAQEPPTRAAGVAYVAGAPANRAARGRPWVDGTSELNRTRRTTMQRATAILKGTWQQLKGEAMVRWGTLTDDDWMAIMAGGSSWSDGCRNAMAWRGKRPSTTSMRSSTPARTPEFRHT